MSQQHNLPQTKKHDVSSQSATTHRQLQLDGVAENYYHDPTPSVDDNNTPRTLHQELSADDDTRTLRPPDDEFGPPPSEKQQQSHQQKKKKLPSSAAVSASPPAIPLPRSKVKPVVSSPSVDTSTTTVSTTTVADACWKVLWYALWIPRGIGAYLNFFSIKAQKRLYQPPSFKLLAMSPQTMNGFLTWLIQTAMNRRTRTDPASQEKLRDLDQRLFLIFDKLFSKHHEKSYLIGLSKSETGQELFKIINELRKEKNAPLLKRGEWTQEQDLERDGDGNAVVKTNANEPLHIETSKWSLIVVIRQIRNLCCHPRPRYGPSKIVKMFMETCPEFFAELEAVIKSVHCKHFWIEDDVLCLSPIEVVRPDGSILRHVPYNSLTKHLQKKALSGEPVRECPKGSSCEYLPTKKGCLLWHADSAIAT